MAVFAVGGGYWGAMTWAPRAEKLQPTVVPASAPAVVEGGSAGVAVISAPGSGGSDDQLVLDALETLERRPNIAASLRQFVRLGDDRLAGEGRFWQQGVGNQRRTRWDLKTLVAGETAFVTQTYDGDVVWTDRKLPATRKVTRVDMAALRREVSNMSEADQQQGRGPLGESMMELMARGGLSQLMAGLHRSFTFGPRQTLRQGNRTMLAVVGQWRPEQLERVWPGASTASMGDWPPHLPHHVLVYIDANDRFPYFIEYRGADQAALATSAVAHYYADDPLASFEFIDVQFAAAMPADTFQFTPPDNSWTDVTWRVIEELRAPPAPVEAEGTARREGTWR
jgi:hypothetical protein